MIVKVLIENTALCNKYVCEHGLSLYLEHKNHKLLFDTGSTNAFIENSKILGVKLNEIEDVIISHGHNDHGGGIEPFLEINKKANVYIHKLAFDEHFSKKNDNNIVNIGLDKSLLNSKQIKLLNQDYLICEDVKTMTNVKIEYNLPITNNNLLEKVNDKFVKDKFVHEQNLVIKLAKDRYVLIVGCAHNGVKNILEHFKNLYGIMPTYVIGGFHLSSRTQVRESDGFIEDLAQYLLSTNAMFYTCHCTGINAYQLLKKIMKNKIEYISAGTELNIK